MQSTRGVVECKPSDWVVRLFEACASPLPPLAQQYGKPEHRDYMLVNRLLFGIAARSYLRTMDALAACESPIEKLMWCALVVVIGQNPDEPVGFHTQAPIGRYRADILVIFEGIKAVVECDGHAFHERSKEQAQRDKKRDRDVQAAGYLVARFTGSEIWNEPLKAAGEVYSLLVDRFSARVVAL